MTESKSTLMEYKGFFYKALQIKVGYSPDLLKESRKASKSQAAEHKKELPGSKKRRLGNYA